MRPVDIERLVSVGRPSLAPDAGFVVYATSRADIAANRAVGQLWRIELPHGEPRRLTRGTADSAPRVSPDGRLVAFLRADGAGKAQVFVIAAGGGEAVQATAAVAGVSAFSWSPDARSLAFTAREPEAGRYGTVEGLTPEAESPRRITGVRWHANGVGYIADRPLQLWVVDAPDPAGEPAYEAAPGLVTPDDDEASTVAASARRLTDPPTSYSGTTWTPDGTEILVVADAIETDARDLRTPLLAVRVDGSGSREIVSTAANLTIDDTAVAPDGAVFVLAHDVGAHGRDFIAPGEALWIVDDDGPRRLTDPEQFDLGEVGSHLVIDGDAVLVHDRRRGRVRVLRVSRTGEVTEVLGGDVEAAGASAAADVVAVAIATPTSFGEVAVVDAAGSRIVTDHGAQVRRLDTVAPREFTAIARDGYPVHGWIATPPGEGPFPVILQIHGGPFAQYGVHLFDETQVLVDAGYAVVYANPRGSAGYGRAHGRAIRQAMGTLDYTDLIDFFDAAVADDARLDGGRAGVMGGSYGGYMTAWIIAHDHRFAGAIVERGFLDPFSFQGTSDIGSFFGDEYVGTDPERMAAQSPMAAAWQVRTPTLVIHSELDFRCPLEQATRYYAALRRQGTPAELLVFPGEDHELSRAGRPRHRIERFDAILDWWHRHLPTGR